MQPSYSRLQNNYDDRRGSIELPDIYGNGKAS